MEVLRQNVGPEKPGTRMINQPERREKQDLAA